MRSSYICFRSLACGQEKGRGEGSGHDVFLTGKDLSREGLNIQGYASMGTEGVFPSRRRSLSFYGARRVEFRNDSVKCTFKPGHA